MTPADVVDEARTWLATPFHHQGRLRGVGVDCIGLVIGVGRSLGLVPPDFDYTGYGRAPRNGELERVLAQHCTPTNEASAGTVAVIRWLREAQHIGILTGDTIIHAMRSEVVEHRLDAKWRKRFVSVWRLPGVTYV